MHLWRKRGHLHGAQCIGRQRASARSKLYIERMVLSPATHPDIRQPQANKLSEHLADFGSCREIACSAQGIAAVIIMGVRLGHVMGDGNGTARFNLTRKPLDRKSTRLNSSH